MNKPILTSAKRVNVVRFLMLKALFLLSLANPSFSQNCGVPSPLQNVPTTACLNQSDTFIVSPVAANAVFQLSVSPPGGVSISHDPFIPAFYVNWGPVAGNYALYFQTFDINTAALLCTDTFNVHVSTAAAPQLNCNDTINISLDENCIGHVTPILMLEGNFDSLEYEVIIRDPKTKKVIPSSPYVNANHIGKYYEVTVRHICSGNTCWGFILVEDKLPPTLVCRSYVVTCDQAITPESIGFPKPVGAPDPDSIGPATYYSNSSFYDNCGSTVLTYKDRIAHVNCNPTSIYIDTVFRDWTATDNYNNVFRCTDTILILIGNISAVICPPNYDNIQAPALNCNDTWKKDASGNPHPDVTGYPSFTRCRNLDFTYVDLKLRTCEGTYKILREWIVADWCTGRQTSCVQVIKVIDDRLVISCGPNITVSTLASTCEGEAYLPIPTVFDDCSSVSWIVKVKRGADPNVDPSAIDATTAGVIKWSDSIYKVTNLPVGLSWVLFIGTDGCGNVDTCATEVTVEEKTRPIAVCDLETVVTLTDDGSAKVYAITFDDGSHDNCGLGTFQVRRMDPGNCPDPIRDSTEFGDYVEFCCSDIPNNPVLVVLRVIDKAGNYNECMVWVTVQDKKPPIVECLPNITVSCEFDRSNLGVFGTYRRVESDRKPIVLYDPTNHTVSQPHLWGRDGLVVEDCNLIADSSVSYNLNSCGLGTITRVFKFQDYFNAPIYCSQVITINDYTPFDGANRIVWPAHIEIDGCQSSIGPEITGKPTWPDSLTCSNILATYEDQVFSVVENVCYKVLRKWTVVDWCIFNSATGYGRWTYIQVIKIKNSIAPTFTSNCTNQTFDGQAVDCNGFATLTASATDDCSSAQLVFTYEIDLGNNGSIDLTGTGNNASGTYPAGTNRIKWTVFDQCGNSSSCSYLFTILDRKKPSPFCRTGIITVIMPSNGQVTVWASDLNSHSQDNCTLPQNLRFSFSSNTAETSRTYTCSQIPNGVSETFDVRIYVTDEAGNQDYCDTKIIIQDGLGNACPDNLGGGGTVANLSGNIYNEANSKMEQAMVTLNANMPSMPKYEMTGTNGQYSFIQLPLNESYILSAHKDDDPLNGVSTQDIVLIQKHILGLQSLGSPYKLIAADVNNSESITAKDVSDIRRLILGITNSFTVNKSWRFISASQAFADPARPWPFQESNTIDKLASDKLDNNFIAVKLGDVSGNARTSNFNQSVSRTGETVKLEIPDISFERGEMLRIPVHLNCDGLLTGIQMEFGYDHRALKFMEVQSAEMVLDEKNYVSDETEHGKLRLSWDNLNGIYCGGPLFYLVFQANTFGAINGMLALNQDELNAEVYDQNAKATDLELEFMGQGTEAKGMFYLFQNQPNPFSHTTRISFQLPYDGKVNLRITDVNGKVLFSQTRVYKQGFNSIELNKQDLNRSGVMYYHLEMDGYKAARKMLILE